MRLRYHLSVLIAIWSVIPGLNSRAEQRVQWNTWQPGDKGTTAGIVLVLSVIDDDKTLVTPLSTLNRQQMEPTELGNLAMGLSDVWFSSNKDDAAKLARNGLLRFSAALTGFQKGDILQARKIFCEEQSDKQFIIDGVPTYGFLDGQVVLYSGSATVAQAQLLGRTLPSVQIQGNFKPTPRKQVSPLEYLRQIDFWSWQPGMVGNTKLKVSIINILGKDTALVVPLYNDIYNSDGLPSVDKKRLELHERLERNPAPRTSKLTSKALDRTFVLTGIETKSLVDGTVLNVDGLVQIDHSKKRGTALVRRLSAQDAENAMCRIDFQERKSSFEASDGTLIALLPLGIQKSDEQEFLVQAVKEDGTESQIPLKNFSKRGQSQVRQFLAKAKKQKKPI